MSRSLKIILAFASVYLIWGSTYLAIRIGIETMPPFLMAGLRHLVAGVIMYAWMRPRSEDVLTRRHWRSAFIIGGLMLLGGNGGVTLAEKWVPSGLAALIVATVPLWIALFNWKWGDRIKPGKRIYAGIVLGMIGLIVLIGPENLMGAGRIDGWGALALVIATVTWSAGSLYSRSAPLPSTVMLAIAMEMIGGGVLLLVLSGLTGEWIGFDMAAVSLNSAGALVYLIFLGSLIGFTAYVWLLRHVAPSKVATYAYVNPLVAVLLGYLFANEPLTPRVAVSALVIIAGVIVITFRRNGKTQPAVEEKKLAA